MGERGLTPKQEKFCQAIVSGKTQADAYRAAYSAEKMKPQTVQSTACLLAQDHRVAARVEELRKPVVEKLQYGLEEAMREAAEAFKVAKDKENGGAMVAAVQLRAKLNGLLVDKKEVRTGQLEDLPRDELKALRDALRTAKAADGADAGATSRTTH